MNKKAQILDMMAHIPKMIILAVIIFVVYSLITSGIRNEINVFNAESELIIQRLLYSKEGLSYYDPDINRLMIGTIDINKFSDNSLQSMLGFNTLDQHLAARFTLSTEKEKKYAFINQEWFFKWLPLTGKLGVGGKGIQKEDFPVMIRNAEGTQEYGRLLIEVILPNA